MVRELWDLFVLLLPVFSLLTLMFVSGFVIGRISKRER